MGFMTSSILVGVHAGRVDAVLAEAVHLVPQHVLLFLGDQGGRHLKLMAGQQLIRHLVFQEGLPLPFLSLNNILSHGGAQVSQGLKIAPQVLGEGVVQFGHHFLFHFLDLHLKVDHLAGDEGIGEIVGQGHGETGFGPGLEAQEVGSRTRR